MHLSSCHTMSYGSMPPTIPVLVSSVVVLTHCCEPLDCSAEETVSFCEGHHTTPHKMACVFSHLSDLLIIGQPDLQCILQ